MSRFILSIFMLFSAEVFCQQEIIIPEGYSKNVMLADSLAEAGIYSAAANAYTIAFRSFNSRGFDVDRLKAARVYALNNQVDSSISSLKRLITLRFYNYKKIEDDKAFKAVVISPQWPSVLESFKINKSRFGPSVNLTLLNSIDSILVTDQAPRNRLIHAQAISPEERIEIEKQMRIVDSVNSQKITQFLDKHVWLGSDVIGMEGTEALFLVIQHAETSIQQKYLPMLREAVKNKKAPPHQLAMLEDRVGVETTGNQLYGSQLFFDPVSGKYKLFPISDEINVDKRRKEVGLEPLASYVKRWDIVYVLPK